MIRILMFTLLLLILSACENNNNCSNFSKKDGLILRKGSDGNRLKFFVKNCSYDGKYIEYYSTGEVRRYGTFSKGQKVGKWNLYDKKSNLFSIWNYRKGELGEIRFYFQGKSFAIHHINKAKDSYLTDGKVVSKLNLYREEFRNLNLEVYDNYLIITSNTVFCVYDASLNLVFNIQSYSELERLYKSCYTEFSISDARLRIEPQCAKSKTFEFSL